VCAYGIVRVRTACFSVQHTAHARICFAGGRTAGVFMNTNKEIKKRFNTYNKS